MTLINAVDHRSKGPGHSLIVRLAPDPNSGQLRIVIHATNDAASHRFNDVAAAIDHVQRCITPEKALDTISGR